MSYIEKKLKYHDMLTENFGDEKKLKKVVDKLVKENMEFDDKQKLIHDIFKEDPTCLRCVDYQTLQKYDNNESTLLTEMLATARLAATDSSMEEFYENFIPESLKRSDNKAFLNFIFSTPEDEASLLENPNFVKTRGVTEKHWESIKKYGRSISKDDKVDTFVSHLANLKTFDQIVKEVAEFVKDPELNFSENEILKVLNNNKRLLKDTRIMSALVEKSTQETEDFDSSEFERLIKKNKSTFNKYLNETRINANEGNRKTLKTCFENIDKETLTTLFGSMSKTNRIEYSADVVRIEPALYQHKKFVKNQENSIAYVKGGGDLDRIPKKLRSNDVTASLAKYYATEYAKPEDFTLSRLFAKMESFDKKHANSTQTLDAIAKSDFYKNSSIQDKREFLSKCNKSYLSDNLPSIIKDDPACLFVKKGDSFTFLVGQNKRENTLWALNHAVQKVGNAPFKNFVSSLPDEVLSNKKLMNEMLARCFIQTHHNFVKDFFESLNYENKNVKENLADILNFAVSTNPLVLQIVKEKAPDELGSALKTRIGKKALFKAIMIDPVSVDFVEGADLSEKLANLKTKQRFVIAQSCISKLASKSYDKKYEKILASVFALDDNGLSKGQVKKLLGSLAKNNTESFVKMYVANVFSEYKNPHVSKILEDNFAKHKNIFGKKLYENYTVSAKGYTALYEECKSQKIKQTQLQILTAEKEIKKAQDNVKWSEKVKGEFEDVVKSIGKLKSPNTVKNRISALKNTLISRYQCLSAGELIGEEQIEEILKTEGSSIKNIKAKLKEHFEQNIIPKMDKSKEDYSENMLKYNEEKQYFEAVLKELGAEMPESAQIDELLKSPIWTKEEFAKKAKELESTQANLVKFNPIITKYNLGDVVPVKSAPDLDVKFVSDFDVEEGKTNVDQKEEKEETETKFDQPPKEEVKKETEEKEKVKKTEEKKKEGKETTGKTVSIIKETNVAEETKVVENFVNAEKIEPKVEIKAETNRVEEPEFELTREDRPHLDVDTFIYKGGDFSKVDDDKYFKEAPLSVEKRKNGFTTKDAYIIDRVIGSGKYNPNDTKYLMEERRKNLLSLLDSLSPNAKKYASWISELGKGLMAFAMDETFDNAQKAEFLAKFGNVFLRSKAKDDIAFGINELFILNHPQMIFAKNSEGKSAVLSEEFLEREKNLGRETKNDFVTKSFDKLNKQFAKEATKKERENSEATKEEREKPEETKEYENLAYFATTMPEDILKDKELLEKLIKVAKSANRTIGQDGRSAYVAKDKDALYAFAQGLSENPNFSSLDPSILKTLATTNNFVGQIKGFENMGPAKGGDDGDGQSL